MWTFLFLMSVNLKKALFIVTRIEFTQHVHLCIQHVRLNRNYMITIKLYYWYWNTVLAPSFISESTYDRFGVIVSLAKW